MRIERQVFVRVGFDRKPEFVILDLEAVAVVSIGLRAWGVLVFGFFLDDFL